MKFIHGMRRAYLIRYLHFYSEFISQTGLKDDNFKFLTSDKLSINIYYFVNLWIYSSQYMFTTQYLFPFFLINPDSIYYPCLINILLRHGYVQHYNRIKLQNILNRPAFVKQTTDIGLFRSP